MNTTRKLLGAAILLALSGAGSAQTSAPSGTGDSSRGTASPAVTSPPGGAAASTAPAAAAAHQVKAARLSILDGVDIYSGESKIGEIEDLVIDPATGRVLHALVEIGGVLGVGGKEFAVPVKQLRVFSRSADDTAPARVELTAAADSLPPAKSLDKDSPYVMGTRLIGTDVQDSSGNEVGEIEDLVVDLETGEAKYALVEFDDSWGGDDRLFAIPMADIKRDPDKKQVTIAVTKESLGKRPSIEKSQLDKMDLSGSVMPATGGSGAAPASGGSSPGVAAPKN